MALAPFVGQLAQNRVPTGSFDPADIPRLPAASYKPRSRRDGWAQGFNVGINSCSGPLTGEENK